MVSLLFGFLYHFAMSRVLSVADYGLLSALLALFLVLNIPRSTIRFLASRRIAEISASQDVSDARRWFSRAVRRVSSVAVLSVFLAMPLMPIAASALKTPSVMPLVLLGLTVVGALNLALATGSLQGAQRLLQVTCMTLTESFGKLGLGLLLVGVGYGISGAVAGMTISVFLALAWGLWQCAVFFRSLGTLDSTSSAEGRGMSTRGASTRRSAWFPSLAFNGLILMTYSIGPVFSRYRLSPRSSGEFAVIATLGRALFFLPSFLNFVMAPRVTSAHVQGRRTLKYLWLSLLCTSFLGVPVLVLYWLFSQPIVKALFGGRYIMATASFAAPYALAMLLLAILRLLGHYWLSKYEPEFLVGSALGVIILTSLVFLGCESIGCLVAEVLIGIGTMFILTLLAKLIVPQRRWGPQALAGDRVGVLIGVWQSVGLTIKRWVTGLLALFFTP